MPYFMLKPGASGLAELCPVHGAIVLVRSEGTDPREPVDVAQKIAAWVRGIALSQPNPDAGAWLYELADRIADGSWRKPAPDVGR